ncbi:MAG: response regulator [Nitrospira sp.]|nr:response regulator [Nitrospira sp.]
MRILVVEDDERIVAFMKRGLEAEDFTVDVALGTSQALDLINSQGYDLLIIDIYLGPDDGLEFCETLRQHHTHLPIVIMTAKGTLETDRTSKAAGANAYLAKPFAFQDLIETIARLGPEREPHDSVLELRSHPPSTPKTN